MPVCWKGQSSQSPGADREQKHLQVWSCFQQAGLWDSPCKDERRSCHLRMKTCSDPMTLLLLLARLLAFGLFYKIVISCITKCVTKPLIKRMTRQLGYIYLFKSYTCVHLFMNSRLL